MMLAIVASAVATWWTFAGLMALCVVIGKGR
jgi:hypothetical protein